MIRIHISEEQRDKISRPVMLPRSAWGGFQHLITRLQSGLRRTSEGWALEMERDDAEAVLRYSNPRYGAGTYQAQLRAIVDDVAAALGPRVESGSLFAESVDA